MARTPATAPSIAGDASGEAGLSLSTEERFRMLADHMSQLAWTCDLLGNVTWYNKRWLEYTGLSFEEMKGWGWSRVQHPDHVDRVVALVRKAGETGEPWEDTFPLRGRDGRYRWFLSRAMPIRDRHNRVVQWFGTNTDVTEQKLAEEQVARQAGELRALNARLQELDRLKTEFFSNVSHEFRTPLTLMLGPTEELLARAEGPDREDLEVVYRNALRLSKLVHALLDFSRIEAGRLQASYEPTDLAVLTADLASQFRSAAERAGLGLVVDCPPLPEPAVVDREMWEKVVLNLLSNALKFTFQGEIRVALRATPAAFELVVSDTGTGIPAHEMPRLFERFHRIRGARARTHEGSGIGLALVKELVQLHGGRVAASSVEGRGSRFMVEVPRGHAHLPADRVSPRAGPALPTPAAQAFRVEVERWLDPPARPDPREGAPAARASGEAVPGEALVLVADDNADMRDYLRKLLGPRWRVALARDGASALEAARRERPDLVLADVMMPGLDGFGLLRALRADGALREVPVLLLSARSGEESRVEGLQAGADDYVVKPFSPRELVARVAAHLDASRIRRQAARELEEVNARLQDLDRRRTELMGVVAHELRNPLTPLLMQVEALLDDPSLGAAHRDRVEKVGRAARRLDLLVADLVDAGHLEGGKLRLDREPVDLAALAREQAEHHPALARRVTLEVRAAGPAWVEADRARMEQVLSNLLGNALKFTPPGGRVLVEVAPSPEEVEVTVRDTGIGLTEEQRARLFRPFSRAHPGQERGTGLGLYISKGIVEAHGGRIRADSEGPGRGSAFTFWLPPAAAPPRA